MEDSELLRCNCKINIVRPFSAINSKDEIVNPFFVLLDRIVRLSDYTLFHMVSVYFEQK